MDNKKILYEIIDKQTRVLVGILCKRVEFLEHNNILTPKIYKDLSKEVIYEWSRALKSIIDIGKINFVSPKQQKKSV